MLEVITPDWPAPKNIRAFTTTRMGGVSRSAFENFNIAAHVGDEAEAVQENRRILVDEMQLPSEPVWLDQAHTNIVVDAVDGFANADASYSDEAGIVCAVMTADCLPVLICNVDGTEVAAVHAGWRGLADGIIENAIAKFRAPVEDLLVWFGPAIGAGAFEVGGDVRDAFIRLHSESEQGFKI